jgi:hypothetical protein
LNVDFIILFYSFMFAAPPLPPLPLLIIAIFFWTALLLLSLLFLRIVLDTINIPNRKDGSPRQPFFSALIPATEQRWQQQQTSVTPSSPQVIPSFLSPWHFSPRFRSFSFSLFCVRSFSFVSTVTVFSLCVLEHALFGLLVA